MKKAAKKVEEGIDAACCAFLSKHRTADSYGQRHGTLEPGDSPATCVAEAFPDGNSALMPICASRRYGAGLQLDNKKYINTKHLKAVSSDTSYCRTQGGNRINLLPPTINLAFTPEMGFTQNLGLLPTYA